MKNLHIIPTEKPSRLTKNNLGKLIKLNSIKHQEVNVNQNIYITSDEEPKEGDIVKIPCAVGRVKEIHWKFGNDYPYYITEDLITVKLRYGQTEGELETCSFVHADVKKIILTTDQDLIKAGVQAIDDEFLEWFVKNPGCEKVEVKKRYSDFTVDPFVGYKIIIPKEDPFEKSKLALRSYLLANNEKVTNDLQEMREKSGIDRDETLEEAVKNKLRKEFENLIRNKTNSNVEFLLESNNTNYISWLENKWQKERMYSEEEVMNIIDSFIDNLQDYTPTFNSRQEWFEQFKKK
jgi:hypothetical protein